jgi:hypothetical protein
VLASLPILLSVAPVVAPVLLTTAAGYAWKRLGQGFDHIFVTRLITSLGAPCLVFSTLSQSSLSFAAISSLALATIACIAWFAGWGLLGLRLSGQPWRVYLPALVFPNIGNIGLPVCLYAFGPDGLSLAMVYFTICSMLQFTIGEAIAAGRFRLSSLLKVPFVYAALLAVGFSLSETQPPAWLLNVTSLIGGLTVPLMLLALGVALAELRIAHMKKALAAALARLGLGMTGALAVIYLFGLTGIPAGVLLVQSMMPVAVFNYLFAKIYGNAPEEVAGTVIVSTVLTYLLLPFLVSFATTWV